MYLCHFSKAVFVKFLSIWKCLILDRLSLGITKDCFNQLSGCPMVNFDFKWYTTQNIDLYSKWCYQHSNLDTNNAQKKWSFPLKVSSVNMTKSAVSCVFGHVYWRNPYWKTVFFVQWNVKFVFKRCSLLINTITYLASKTWYISEYT